MNFLRRNNKMNVNRGVARAAPRVPMMPPLYVPKNQHAINLFQCYIVAYPICRTEHLQWTMFLLLVRK